MTSFIDAVRMDGEKEKLKVAYADFWPEWSDEDFITPILKRHFDVTFDSQNPDVLFHSMFGNKSQEYKCKKILYIAENIRYPYNNIIRNNIDIALNSDYKITFDPHSDTNFRLPLWQAFILKKPELWDRLIHRKRVEEFERFCAFTVSNPSNMLRNNHFDVISQYKRVNAYGKVRMNDTGLKRASEGRYWRDAKDEFFLEHPHKFMMAYENTSYPWYCTEKLMDAFLVGSVPIYWGDPKVSEDWNPIAFINVQQRKDWFDIVKTADTNKTFWEDLYEEPVFTEEQQNKHEENMRVFEEWLIFNIKK